MSNITIRFSVLMTFSFLFPQSLREVIPHVANKNRRLSKLETLTLAKNYIVALTGLVVHDDDVDAAAAAIAAINGEKIMAMSLGNGNNAAGPGSVVNVSTADITSTTAAAIDLMRSTTECLSLVSKDCLLQGTGAEDFTFDLDLDMNDQQDALGFYDD